MNIRGIFAGAFFFFALLASAPDFCFAGGPQTKDFREVESFSNPVYRARSALAWQTHGRLVGQATNPPPKFRVVFFKPESEEPYRTFDFDGSVSVYESGWVLPGKYRLLITAEGFVPKTLKEVEIRKGFDCIMDINFGAHVYHTF